MYSGDYLNSTDLNITPAPADNIWKIFTRVSGSSPWLDPVAVAKLSNGLIDLR